MQDSKKHEIDTTKINFFASESIRLMDNAKLNLNRAIKELLDTCPNFKNISLEVFEEYDDNFHEKTLSSKNINGYDLPADIDICFIEQEINEKGEFTIGTYQDESCDDEYEEHIEPTITIESELNGLTYEELKVILLFGTRIKAFIEQEFCYFGNCIITRQEILNIVGRTE